MIFERFLILLFLGRTDGGTPVNPPDQSGFYRYNGT